MRWEEYHIIFGLKNSIRTLGRKCALLLRYADKITNPNLYTSKVDLGRNDRA
jgi:hypothetical protein